MKPAIILFIAVIASALMPEPFLHAETNVTLSATNQAIHLPDAAVPMRPGMEYERLDSVRAKSPSALLSSKSYGTPGQLESIAMDGGNSSHTGIAMDGNTVQFGQMGGLDTSILPLELAESSDIYKNNLLPYGINASTGMINFNLPDARTEKTEIAFYGGDYYRFGGKGILSRQIGPVDALIGISGSFASNNFEYTNIWGITNQAVNLDYYKYSLLTKVLFKNFEASLSWTEKNGGTGARYSSTGREKDNLLTSGLNWSESKTKAGISYMNWLNVYTDPASGISEKYTNQTFSAAAEKTFTLDWYSLKTGLRNNLFLLEGTGIGNRLENETSLYFENILKFEPFEADLSLNQIFQSGTPVLIPGFSAAWKPLEWLQWSASVSRNYRFPAFNDLYWPEDNFSKGNPGLKPENGLSWKTGITFLTLPVIASVFYSETALENLILWNPSGGKWEPENIGKTRSQDLSLTVFAEKYIGPFHMVCNGSFSWNNAINNATDSVYFKKRLIYTPLYKTALSAGFSFLKTWGIDVSFRHESERFTTEANTAWLPSYYTADIRLYWEFLYLSAENILDKRFEENEGYPQMGRSFTAGIDYKF